MKSGVVGKTCSVGAAIKERGPAELESLAVAKREQLSRVGRFA